MHLARFKQHGFATLQEIGYHPVKCSLALYLSRIPAPDKQGEKLHTRSYQDAGFASLEDWILSLGADVTVGADGLRYASGSKLHSQLSN